MTLAQVIATSAFVLAGKYLGLLQVDEMVWDKIKPYLIYVAAFTLGVMANMKVCVPNSLSRNPLARPRPTHPALPCLVPCLR